MAKRVINVGVSTNDGKGDSLRVGAQKINDNFTELYTALGANTGSLSIVSGLIAGAGITVSSKAGEVLITNKIASDTTLGGIKIGENLTITEDGTLNANPGAYTLPVAEAGTLGGVKIGSGITISPTGVISAQVYTLPTATDTVLGGVKIGARLTITDGVLSANVQSYNLPKATDHSLGGVIVDGSTVIINDNGVISAPTSSVSTGNITFDGVKIVGNTVEGFVYNAISLVPDNTQQFLDWGQYLNIYPTTNNDAPHIHIAAGSGSQSNGDLILGDDNQYVDINHQGYVSIKSYNAVTGNSYIWSFGTDGVLQGPVMGQVLVPALAGPPGSDLYLNAGNDYLPQGQFIQFSDADGTAKTTYTVDATSYPLVGIPQTPYATLFLSPGNNIGVSFVSGQGVWTAVFGQAVTLTAATDYWLEYASIQTPSVNINTGYGSWSFKNNGALEQNNSWTRVTMSNIGSGPSTVVWTSNVDYISGAKLTIQVEAHEVGDSTGWHSQVCEAIIASRGYMNSVGGPGGEPVMTVYGVTHTSTVPLVTFTVQRNPTTKMVEIVGTLTAATTAADLRIYSVETSTRD